MFHPMTHLPDLDIPIFDIISKIIDLDVQILDLELQIKYSDVNTYEFWNNLKNLEIQIR